MIFHFPFRPIAKERPRITSRGAYTPKRTAAFESQIRAHALKEMQKHEYTCVSEPIDCHFVFYFPRPKKLIHEFPMQGDLDNYVKSVADALNGTVWDDDRLIVSMSAMKQYSPTQDPYIHLHVNRMHQ